MIDLINVITNNHKLRIINFLLLCVLFLYGCRFTGTPTPNTEVMSDSFFFGHAFVDTNGNKIADDRDKPLEGARFTATDARGASSGGLTGKDGSAFAWWPGESHYPVTLHMEAPEGGDLVIIGPSDVILEEFGSSATFLYKQLNQEGNPSSTPSAEILSDSFFSGHALIDSNGNGTADDSDMPLQGALFTATDARGANGGGFTDKDGSAQAWWPGESHYPVTLHMEPPEGSSLVIIGPSDVILEEFSSSATFLFEPLSDEGGPTSMN
jgi:hypothetical protein